jgi:hypothetical protein
LNGISLAVAAWDEIRFIKFRLISRVYQSKLGPLEDHCPSLEILAQCAGPAWPAPGACHCPSDSAARAPGDPGPGLPGTTPSPSQAASGTVTVTGSPTSHGASAHNGGKVTGYYNTLPLLKCHVPVL